MVACPCINSTSIFLSLSNCITPSGYPGLTSSTDGICYPANYGSSSCNKYDEMYDPVCHGNKSSIPKYCDKQWCYVDKESCMLSDDYFYPSDRFGDELFYSYSTCNSSASAWIVFQTTDELAEIPVLKAVVPGSNYPFQYKLTEEGGRHAAFAGPEYYNNSIPYQGALVDYLDRLSQVMDLGEIKFNFRSKGSDRARPDSSFTASVRDVQIGLADIGVGSYWVTAERLRMTAFTSQIGVDRTLLVMQRNDDSFWSQISRVMEPFDASLWILLFFVLIGVSALSLLFASPLATNKRPWIAFRSDEWKSSSNCRRAFIFHRHVLEALLEKGVFCFGGASDQDFRSSLSMKFLIFGFSFMILIVVSAYTANLAAFLTQSAGNYVDTVEKAVDKGIRICAHPAIISTFRAKWPDGKFVKPDYSVSGEGNIGIDEDYFKMIRMFDDKRCELLAWGEFDFRYSFSTMELFCERNLVVTQHSIHDVPIAMPVKKDIAAAISYLFFEAEKQHGITFMDMLRNYEEQTCNVDMSSDSAIGSGLSQKMTISNMACPFLVLALCILIGLTLKMCDRRNVLRFALSFTKSTRMSKRNTERIIEAIKFAHLDMDHHSADDNEYPDDSSDEEDELPANKRKSDARPSIHKRKSYHRGVSETLRSLSNSEKKGKGATDLEALPEEEEEEAEPPQTIVQNDNATSFRKRYQRGLPDDAFHQCTLRTLSNISEDDSGAETPKNLDEEAIKAMIEDAVESSTLRMENAIKALVTKAMTEKENSA